MRIGLVLAGGLARGSAQLGFVEGFFSVFNYDDIKIISSSSIGSINAIAISMKDISKLKDKYMTSDYSNAKMLKNIVKNDFIGKCLDEITSMANHLTIPCYVSASCFNNLSEHYFLLNSENSYDDIKDIINLTTKNIFVNGLFKKYNGLFYTDGGTFDNIPTYPLNYYDLDLILILHSTANYYPPVELYNKNSAILDLNVTNRCKVEVSTFSFQHENLVEMYESGFKYGYEIAERLYNKENIEELKKECQQIVVDEYQNRKEDWNAQSIVEVINKIFQSRRNL